ncbi:MAG: translocation/assembly module TamB domain-containing protein [Ignavibacteria bacterium]|nr:translocation/assembly module TamB domain-containing protein [Ignavibacteria bacterium]
MLKDFNIDSLDIYIRSRKILLLSSASAATSPTLYGKFVISTGREPLHFFGTLQKPFLRGDVNIEDASLTFPPDKQLKVSASTFRYSVDSTKGRMTILITKDTISDSIPIVPHSSALSSTIETEKEKADKKRRGPGLNELIDYDVFVKIPGNFNLKMILGQFDQLEANIGPKDRTIPLHFVQPPLSKPKLYGDIIIKEGSKYKFFKVFDASGSLQFNTGAIDNPQLNIFAKYKGQRDKDNRRQDYVVNLSISGSKNLPILGISYQIDGMDAAGDSAKVRSDAILMLLLGKTQDELRPGSGVGGQLNLTNELSSGASGVVSSQLSSLIQGTGVFTDAQIDFVGGVQDLSQARLNISGQLFGNVSWRIGGTLGDVTANSQFSVDIPLNILGDYELLNNFILQLTKTINANATTNRQQKDWEIKPGFRYSF